MKKILWNVFIAFSAFALFVLTVGTLTPERTKNRVVAQVVEFFFSDTIAGMANDVDGNPVFYSDGSEGAKVFLQMARMPDHLNEIMEKAEGGNLSKGQVLRLTCSKDMKTILRVRIVNDRSAFYTNPEAPLPKITPEQRKKNLMTEEMEDNRPLDQSFPEGATVEEAINALPFGKPEITSLAMAN